MELTWLTIGIAALLLVVVYLFARVLQTARSAVNEIQGEIHAASMRTDQVMQNSGFAFAETLQKSSTNLVENVAKVREEVVHKVEETQRLFSKEVQAEWAQFRQSMDDQQRSSREELGAAIATFQRNNEEQLAQNRREVRESLESAFQMMDERFRRLQESNEQRLGEIRENLEGKMNENIEKNLGVFRDVSERIAELRKTADTIVEISDGINELTGILESPRLRGEFGEFELSNMLREIVPADRYEAPGQLGTALADAVIFLKEGKLCIDSKFPLANFQRMHNPQASDQEREEARKAFVNDFYGHVDSIKSKYIVPKETLDLAFMFVPAESVFYEVLTNFEFHEYALRQGVIPVSPNSLYAYLHVIAIGFRGMKIQEEARRIQEILLSLKEQFDSFRESFDILGTHLDNARKRFETATQDVRRFDVTLSGLKLGAIEAASEAAALAPPADAAAKKAAGA
ncbi:MAG TPA: DNA recombination protein RmuC [Candidatus Acidoferrales bacterium]